MAVVRADGFVHVPQLDSIRDHLKAAKAADVLAALAVYDRCYAFERRMLTEGDAAHRAPHEARRRHHDLVVADALAGRDPDDARLWGDVMVADHELDRAQARHAAAKVAVERAGIALLRVFGSFWPVLLPYVARKRSEDLTDPLRALADTLSWPVLRDPVGVPTRNTYPSQHFSVWWPLDVERASVHRRDDYQSWNE